MNPSLVCVLVAAALTAQAAQAAQSGVWDRFVAAVDAGQPPEVADFSYAGYRYSEAAIPDVDYDVFDIREYGAIPDDGKSDKKAIQKAIRAAEKNGSGIVYFPAGRFVVNTQADKLDVIRIRQSNIVFKGEGEEKSLLFFERDLPPADPDKLWTVPYALTTDAGKNGRVLTEVVADSPRESRTVTVAKAGRIRVGDWVILEVLNNDPDLVRDELGGLALEKGWTSIIEDGVQVNERHRVKAVDGNTLTFYEPIHYRVQAKHGWRIREFRHLEGIGFENLTFEGGWVEPFVHHRSTRDDGGWSILKLAQATDSWIRNVTFRNTNRPAAIHGSSATSVVEVTIEGSVGHHAISATGGSTGVLLAGVNDTAGMWHSIGVGGGSTTGTVIWRSTYAAHTSFESHASQPRTTLLDNVTGGFFSGRAGGAVKNLPNHARGLVLWNFKEIDEPESNFEFIDRDLPYWRVVPPVVVGFHGTGTTFKDGTAMIVESLGVPVQPESLFEAQLRRRLGELPPWIEAFKRRQANNEDRESAVDQ